MAHRKKEEQTIRFECVRDALGGKRIIEGRDIIMAFDGNRLYEESSFAILRGER